MGDTLLKLILSDIPFLFLRSQLGNFIILIFINENLTCSFCD